MAEESEITSEIFDDTIAAAGPVPKILFAEDIPDLRDAIVMVLGEQGAASDGLEATALVPDFDPDLVILDMRTAPHHFASIPAFLAESRRVLRASGVLLLVDTTTSENEVARVGH